MKPVTGLSDILSTLRRHDCVAPTPPGQRFGAAICRVANSTDAPGWRPAGANGAATVAPADINGSDMQARLAVSAKAIAMLNEAAGRPDPASGTFNTARHALDINGYTARDIAWLRASDGHVVLVLPGNARPVREYQSLDAMRADIRKIARTSAGRRELASHFAHCNRGDGLTYQGVDRWLVDIAAGGHDRRIACCRAPFDGNVLVAARLPSFEATSRPDRDLRPCDKSAVNPESIPKDNPKEAP